MLRMKVTGSRKELIWLQRNLKRWGLVEVMNVTQIDEEMESNKFHRMYIEMNRIRKHSKPVKKPG